MTRTFEERSHDSYPISSLVFELFNVALHVTRHS